MAIEFRGGRRIREPLELWHYLECPFTTNRTNYLVRLRYALAKGNVQRAFPERTDTRFAQLLVAADYCQEMIAGQLPHLGREATGAIREENLGFAELAGVQQDLAGSRVAGGVLDTDPELKVAKRNPARLAAPA